MHPRCWMLVSLYINKDNHVLRWLKSKTGSSLIEVWNEKGEGHVFWLIWSVSLNLFGHGCTGLYSTGTRMFISNKKEKNTRKREGMIVRTLWLSQSQKLQTSPTINVLRERQKLLEHKGVNLSEFLVFKRPQAGSTERIYYPSFFPWFYKHYLFPLSFCYMLVI